MHTPIPITHVFLRFLCFSFLSFFFLALSLILAVVLPSFTIHNYCLLPLNCFWLVVGILPRLPTGLPIAQPLPLHCVGCATPHSQTKNGLFYLLPVFVLITLICIRAKPLPRLPLWHASNDSNSYLLLLGEMSSH